MVVAEHREISVLELGVYVVSIPLYDIILKGLAELVHGVHLILDYLLARATVEEIQPGFSDIYTFKLRALEEPVVDSVWL